MATAAAAGSETEAEGAAAAGAEGGQEGAEGGAGGAAGASGEGAGGQATAEGGPGASGQGQRGNAADPTLAGAAAAAGAPSRGGGAVGGASAILSNLMQQMALAPAAAPQADQVGGYAGQGGMEALAWFIEGKGEGNAVANSSLLQERGKLNASDLQHLSAAVQTTYAGLCVRQCFAFKPENKHSPDLQEDDDEYNLLEDDEQGYAGGDGGEGGAGRTWVEHGQQGDGTGEGEGAGEQGAAGEEGEGEGEYYEGEELVPEEYYQEQEGYDDDDLFYD